MVLVPSPENSCHNSNIFCLLKNVSPVKKLPSCSAKLAKVCFLFFFFFSNTELGRSNQQNFFISCFIVFIAEITGRAFIVADSNKRRTLSRADIAKALTKSDHFDFLIDIVPREEAAFSGQVPPPPPLPLPPPSLPASTPVVGSGAVGVSGVNGVGGSVRKGGPGGKHDVAVSNASSDQCAATLFDIYFIGTRTQWYGYGWSCTRQWKKWG